MKKNERIKQMKNQRQQNRLYAERHEDMVNKLFKHQINDSIKQSVIYSPDSFKDQHNKFTDHAKQIVWQLPTDQASIKAFKQFKHQRIASLNFADYRDVGGGYLRGMMAQEEAICGQSDLYPVISSQTDYYDWNNKHMNRGIYLNRAIYSPNILWGTSTVPQGKTDVITCAAPHKSRGKYLASDPKKQAKFYLDADSAMLNRMYFVKQIAEDQHVDVLILGAWGAGAFGFDAKEVAKMWQKVFELPTSIKQVIYAVVGDKRSHRAVDAFKEVFSND